MNYKSHVEGNGKTVDVEARYAEYSLKQEFGVTVEGDLNEQEVKDLAKLFRKVANIFKKFLSGQDDAALAKTAKLAERFGKLSSLSSLDLSVDVERSVTVLAAQIASEVTAQPALPTGQQPQGPASTSHVATPGGAPSTAAAIPQPSTGTTAPTPSSTTAPVASSANVTHLSVPAQETLKPTSLVQQVLDTLKDTKVESHKVRKYLPDFFKRLQEDLRKDLRDERENKPTPTNEVQAPANRSAFFAYQATSHTSVSLSIRT